MQHISWKKSAGAKSSFRQIYTKYCLEFIRLDKDSKYDEWLFLGAFKNDGIISHEVGSNNEYAINNFQFSILEVFLNQNSNDKHILDREKYWKKVLYTKERGNNDN